MTTSRTERTLILAAAVATAVFILNLGANIVLGSFADQTMPYLTPGADQTVFAIQAHRWMVATQEIAVGSGALILVLLLGSLYARRAYLRRPQPVPPAFAQLGASIAKIGQAFGDNRPRRDQ